MDDKRIDKAAAFDTLFTSNRIQILKILAYYMDPRLLKGLAVYIKMSELQYTLTLFRRHPETSLCIAPSSHALVRRDSEISSSTNHTNDGQYS